MPLRFIKPCCFFKIRLQSSKSLQDKQRRWKQCVIKRKVTGGTDPSPMVCCGLQWLFDSKQSRKRQHRQQRQPRKKKTGKRQTQGDRVTGWGSKTIHCRILLWCVRRNAGVQTPRSNKPSTRYANATFAYDLYRSARHATCKFFFSRRKVHSDVPWSMEMQASSQAEREAQEEADLAGLWCNMFLGLDMTGLCVEVFAFLWTVAFFSHGEETRIKREEDEKRGKDVMSVSMPQALAPDMQLGTHLPVSFGPLSLHNAGSAAKSKHCWQTLLVRPSRNQKEKRLARIRQVLRSFLAVR